MSPRPIRHLAVVLVLGSVLFAPWAAAAQPLNKSWASVLSSPSDLFPRAWGLLARLWDKEGCLIDPSGSPSASNGAQCAASTPQKAGCGIDPSGRSAGRWEKEGCGIDPDGKRAVSIRNKEGCGIDPSGQCIP